MSVPNVRVGVYTPQRVVVQWLLTCPGGRGIGNRPERPGGVNQDQSLNSHGVGTRLETEEGKPTRNHMSKNPAGRF